MASEEKTILVTGGAGYIGAHACKLLAQAGWTPVVYDNFVYGHRDAVQWGPSLEGDLLDRARLDAAIRHFKPRAAMHFAAYAYVGESVENPGKYYRNNVCGTLSLLEALRDHEINRIVFSSTCATYGVPQRIPIPEDHPQNPINPYGASKLMVERMLNDFDAAYGLKSASLRYFNAAGADPEGEIGEDHNPETHLIPIVLDVALGLRGHVQVFGNDYDTPDGTCIRDYIHIMDLGDAHLRALDYLDETNESIQLNLGNGQGYSVNEVIERARAVTGLPIKVEIGPRRAGDPARLVGDAARARKALGWKPRYGDLDVILQHAWAWHQKRFGS